MSVRCMIFSSCLAFVACSGEKNHAPLQASDAPTRIVSLDICADQYVLELVPPESILAVSPDAVKPFSYKADAAIGIPTVRPVAEDVLLLKPDLIVRTYGGGPRAEKFFETAGIPVVTIGWAGSIDDIQRVVQETATALGQPQKGTRLAATMQARLKTLETNGHQPRALYMTPSGATSGEGTLVHDMMIKAGLANYETRSGWHSLPLERIVADTPDLTVGAFFDSSVNDLNGWSASRHPIATTELEKANTVNLLGAWTSCSGWFTLDAIEAMAEAAHAP